MVIILLNMIIKIKTAAIICFPDMHKNAAILNHLHENILFMVIKSIYVVVIKIKTSIQIKSHMC